jgi:hypothetical protein
LTASLFDPPPATATKAKAPEIVAPEQTAIAHRPGTTVVLPRADEYEQELSLIDQLTVLDHGAAIFERRTELIERCRISAIRATQPSDWVLFRDKAGVEVAMLCGPGADIVAQFYGIEIANIRPQREGSFAPALEKDGDEKQLVAWCDARSKVTGQALQSIEARRSTSEDFVGRGGLESSSALVGMADLRASVYRLLRTKAVRILASMTRVSRGLLDEAWKGTEKSSEQCRKGSGYGTSSERGATRVADADVIEARDKLRDEILRRVGGDTAAARDVLKEITANPPKFKGFDSIDRLAQGWQVENAAKKLAEHPVFGDAASKGGK